ncbi:MAG TPA: aldehyde dehydrogenase (NADP(+)) [Gammaproteobacteria bacterium]|nr:aldehyde dehydrogenase (NADP(+)) [Gammaproteobacteria bacterium]
MQISGAFFIGSEAATGRESFAASDPATGSELEPRFHIASRADVESACALARAAFDPYRRVELEDRARFLETIAEQIEALGDPLITRAIAETALPRPRLEGERLRTVNQLRFFADVVRSSDWLDLRIEHALPERTPPRPDLRLRRIPLGPVAVFGASNFPLAFSVAGGDTASALAAGCPVVVRAHAAHPGVSELIGSAIAAAVNECGLHPGVFSMLAGPSYDLGSALVGHPSIKAVGFTGSRSGGLALCGVAAARSEPIPVFAEMSSVNPIFLLPGALDDAAALAQAYVTSLTLGAGQFCTNPGLVFAPAGEALEQFIAAAAAALAESGAQTMLTAGIHETYDAAITRLSNAADVLSCARGREPTGKLQARAALFVTDSSTFASNPLLGQESFGPASIIVRAHDADSLVDLVDGLEGQLTASIHMRDADSPLARKLLAALELKAGRIIVNGWPTGVEVSRAMVHGGPFPATSDGRTTSVGALAIERFLRPVCYQDVPDGVLPEALRETTTDVERIVDGVRAMPE